MPRVADATQRFATASFWNRCGDATALLGYPETVSEIGVGESLAEMFNRFPDSIVQKDAALANRSMELGGDEAGLLLHPPPIGLPGFEQRGNVLSLKGEKVDENDGCWLKRVPGIECFMAHPLNPRQEKLHETTRNVSSRPLASLRVDALKLRLLDTLTGARGRCETFPQKSRGGLIFSCGNCSRWPRLIAL